MMMMMVVMLLLLLLLFLLCSTAYECVVTSENVVERNVQLLEILFSYSCITEPHSNYVLLLLLLQCCLFMLDIYIVIWVVLNKMEITW